MIFRSPYPDITLPEIPFTQFLLRHAYELGDKPALINGATGQVLTYEQLVDSVHRTAAGLAERGLKKGDICAIYSANVPEYAIAFHAISLIGGIITTVNPLYKKDELIYQLNDAGAKYLFTHPMCMPMATTALGKTDIQKIFVFGQAEGATPFDSLMTTTTLAPEVDINPREDLVMLPYSSGTTGLPKGVMITHFNIVSNILQTSMLEIISDDDTLIAVLPFSHIYGIVIVMSLGLYNGATIVTMPRFDLKNFLRIVQDYRVTRAHLVPPLILALATHPMVDDFDLSKLEMILCGAAPVSTDLLRICSKRLDCVIKQAYGLTELSPACHFNPDDPNKIKLASVGPGLPNTEFVVMDTKTGKELGPNQHGEIWVRGPQVMKGYLNNPEATADTIDRNDWLHTGDIGYVDEEGYLYIVDRLKEYIKYKGYQVAPAELEAILVEHPDVADAAVIPHYDKDAVEVPKAYIVLKNKVTKEELIQFVATRVASFKKIRKVEFIDNIPRSASGKILRRLLVTQDRKKYS